MRGEQAKENNLLKFLYHTVLGRMFLKFLTRPGLSRAVGRFLDSRPSTVLIPFFRRKYRISMKNVEIPAGGFPSFNAFFCRRRQGDGKRISDLMSSHDGEGTILVSPCDAFLTCIPIRKDQIFDIKHTKFSLQDLLHDKALAREFEEGYALVFRLTPAHYHRYAYAADGRVLCWRRVPGILHCVRPICTRQVPVYAQNAREYQVIQTERFGKIIQMEVGALLIGRITNEPPGRDGIVHCHEAKGRFEFGGSTIILLLQRGSVNLREELLHGGASGREVAISMGEVLAKTK